MTARDILTVRDFNRFYTGVIGLLDNHILNSPFTLSEARVLYELYHHQPCSATTILETMDMDKGYLSRVLKSFQKKGMLKKLTDKSDGRAVVLSLTAKGENEFVKIDQASMKQLSDLLSKLSPKEIESLLVHMQEIKRIITQTSEI